MLEASLPRLVLIVLARRTNSHTDEGRTVSGGQGTRSIRLSDEILTRIYYRLANLHWSYVCCLPLDLRLLTSL